MSVLGSGLFVITHHARCGFVIRNGYLADLQSASRLQYKSTQYRLRITNP